MVDSIDLNSIYAIGVSIVCGSIIGFEREYRNKSAGFRTIVLICFGSTIFTMMSRTGIMSDDRIAANIITGIGFLGAGVIFKGKLSVQGLTTAAVIWAMAAIGMAIGFGQFLFSLVLTAVMFIILAFFNKIERFLSSYFFARTVFITFSDLRIGHVEAVEKLMTSYDLKYVRKSLEKQEGKLNISYEIAGRRSQIIKFTDEAVCLDYIATLVNS